MQSQLRKKKTKEKGGHPFPSTPSASLSRISGPRNPTPVGVIQSASGFSYFDFPSSWPTDFGRCPFRPFSSGRFQISFPAFSNFGCMHLRNTWVRDILHCSHPSIYRILAYPDFSLSASDTVHKASALSESGKLF
jgi:hypothetical protein